METARTTRICSFQHQINIFLKPFSLQGGVIQWLEHMTDGRKVMGSNPAGIAFEFRQLHLPYFARVFRNGGPFYLVAMPGEVKDTKQERENYEINPCCHTSTMQILFFSGTYYL